MNLARIIFLTSILSWASAWSMEGGRVESPEHEKLTKDIDKRGKDIEAQKKKIQEIESEKGRDETLRLNESVKEEMKLKEMLDAQINDLRKFSIEFPSERESANIKEGQAELEKQQAEKKIVQLEQALEKSGTPVDVNPAGPSIEINLSGDLKAALEADKTVSSRFSKKLEAFFNEYKAKINELPFFGNPRKVIEARTRLNEIYDALGEMNKQIDNLQNWGDYLVDSSLMSRDYFKIQESVRKLEMYIKSLDALNEKISKDNTTTQKEKLTLQKQALENILVRSAFDLARLQEHIKSLTNAPELNQNTYFKSGAEKMINKIATLMNDTLLGFNVTPFLRTEAEKNKAEIEVTKEVKSFLTDQENKRFNENAQSLMTTLKTQPAGVGTWVNFSDYKQFNDYLTKFEGFDTNLMVNAKNLSDDQMLKFSQRVGDTFFDMAQSVGDRYEKLEKTTPRTPKIDAELKFLKDFYNRLVDGVERWTPLQEAYESKIISNAELKAPQTELEKIIRDNKNAQTKINELNNIFSSIEDEQTSVSSHISKADDFIKNYKSFQKEMASFLTIINDPTTAPSRDGLKKLKQLSKILDDIRASLESYGQEHSIEDVPTAAIKDELAKILIDIVNKKALLKNRIAVFNNALLVTDQNGITHAVDQISRDYAQKAQINDGKITDPTIKAIIDTAREDAKKKISLVMETPKEIATYRQRIFDEVPSQQKNPSGGGSSGDESGGGYDN